MKQLLEASQKNRHEEDAQKLAESIRMQKEAKVTLLDISIPSTMNESSSIYSGYGRRNHRMRNRSFGKEL